MRFAIIGKVFAAASGLAAVALLASWNAIAAPATIAAMMVGVMNPAANVLWSAGAKDVLSDKDWVDVKQAVATLSAAAVVVGEGRTVPVPDQAHSEKWQEWSTKLTSTVRGAKNASDRRDKAALTRAGDMLVQVCEGCHAAVATSAP